MPPYRGVFGQPGAEAPPPLSVRYGDRVRAPECQSGIRACIISRKARRPLSHPAELVDFPLSSQASHKRISGKRRYVADTRNYRRRRANTPRPTGGTHGTQGNWQPYKSAYPQESPGNEVFLEFETNDVSLLITSYGIGPGSHELGLVSLLGTKGNGGLAAAPNRPNPLPAPNRIEFGTVKTENPRQALYFLPNSEAARESWKRNLVPEYFFIPFFSFRISR